jgi:hypothetical protein
MNVEDSYEGAVRRMQRLDAARLGVDGAAYQRSATSLFEEAPERMRELEELATLACEDNERLKAELAAAMSELEGLRAAVNATRREAETAYHENEQLRANVASLQQALAGAQQAPAIAQPAQQTFAQDPFGGEALADEEFDYPPKQNRKPLLIVGAAAMLVVGLFILRPWESSHAAPPVVVVQTPPAKVEPTPPAPTPPPAPSTQIAATAAPTAAATIPKIAPTVPKAAPAPAAPSRVTKSRASHKRAKHGANKHGKGAESKAKNAFDDPLGGTNL